MTEWTDVADSAIKIGLGALIGGGFTVWLQALKDKNTISLESYKRRKEIIEEISNEFSVFNKHLSHFWAALKNAFYKNNHNTITKNDKEELKELEKNIYNQFAEVALLSNKLHLIAEYDADVVLDGYVENAREFFKVANLSNTTLNDELMDKYRSEFLEERKRFLEKLSIAFNQQA